jgi:hypothetical protein
MEPKTNSDDDSGMLKGTDVASFIYLKMHPPSSSVVEKAEKRKQLPSEAAKEAVPDPKVDKAGPYRYDLRIYVNSL